MNREEAKKLVFGVIDKLNEKRGKEKKQKWSVAKGWYSAEPKPLFPKDENMVMMGKGAVVESIELGELVAVTEELLMDMGHNVSLTDDRAFSASRSPFRTLGTMIDTVVVMTS